MHNFSTLLKMKNEPEFKDKFIFEKFTTLYYRFFKSLIKL